jgi:hypothetical protein
MHRDEVTTPRRGSDHGTSSATRSGKFAVPDSRNSRDMALSFSPDEWQDLCCEGPGHGPLLVKARGRQPHAEVVCDAITE